MKQYTTPKQTAQLIELGFEKPKSMEVYRDGHCVPFVEQRWDYSIGELIEMLPAEINIDGTLYAKVIYKNEVYYYLWSLGEYAEICDKNNELIDNLYDMIVKLKEKGII